MTGETAKWGDDFSRRWKCRYTHATIINILPHILWSVFIDIQNRSSYTSTLQKQCLIKQFQISLDRVLLKFLIKDGYMGREFGGPAGGIVALDKTINHSLAGLRKPLLVKAAEIITTLGSGPLCLTVYVVLLLLCREACGTFIYAVVTAEIFELCVIIPLRYLVKRERPRPHHGRGFFADWNRYSFPSLHASRACMLAFVGGTYWQVAAPYMLAGAVVVGFTRIFLEKHYMSDVIVGAAIGGLVAAAALCLNA